MGGVEQRIGIEVEERSFGSVPAALTLDQSVIQGATLEGIRARNASLTVTNVTVRNIGGASPVGVKRCLGNGVRVTWDREPQGDEPSPSLTMESSLVEKTQETGILVEGASASLKRVLVRDTAKDPCADGLGDGVAAYSDAAPLPRASIDMIESRIEQSARAAVASFGASVSIQSSALLGATGIAARNADLREVYCAASDALEWTPCTRSEAPSERAILGGFGCNADDDTVCNRACASDAANSQQPRIPDARVWALGHDEIYPAITDSNGCFELEGLPPNTDYISLDSRRVGPASEPFDAVSALEAYAPGTLSVTSGSSDDSPSPLLPSAVQYGIFSYFASLVQGGCASSCPVGSEPPRPDFDFDLSVGAMVGVWVCAAHPELVPAGTDICRSADRRVEGVTVTLDQGIGAYYTSSNTLAVNQSARRIVTPGPWPCS